MAGQLVTKSSCRSGQQCESSIHDDNPQCIVTVARETGTEILANLQCTTTCFKNSESSNAVQVIIGWLCQNLSSCLNILVLIEDTLLVEGNLLIFTKVYQCVELNLFCFLTHKHCMILPCNISLCQHWFKKWLGIMLAKRLIETMPAFGIQESKENTSQLLLPYNHIHWKNLFCNNCLDYPVKFDFALITLRVNEKVNIEINLES